MSRYDDLRRLAAVETDDCVVWPYQTYRKGHGVLSALGRRHYAHRLALQIVSGQDGAGLQAAHGPCHNPACINARAGHVYWADNKRNQNDRTRDGTDNRGTRNGSAKLTPEDVSCIRELTGVVSGRQIAFRLGAHPNTVYDVQRGRTWNYE